MSVTYGRGMLSRTSVVLVIVALVGVLAYLALPEGEPDTAAADARKVALDWTGVDVADAPTSVTEVELDPRLRVADTDDEDIGDE